mmetsp:Transcript_35405/g.140746  ORF Transcript_35405/g.140746 Transcript_35405/m.140746 type:complete len:167 (+) Transcript_35405:75-575(+)
MSELTMDLSDYGIDEQLSEASGSLIVVMYRLPIIAERVEGSKEWDFTFDNDALYMTFEGLNESLQEKGKKVTWVGVLNLDEEIEEDEQRLISKQLWDRFRCAPVWIPRRTIELFYKGFCKGKGRISSRPQERPLFFLAVVARGKRTFSNVPLFSSRRCIVARVSHG